MNREYFNYRVYSDGRVWSNFKNDWKQPVLDTDGYLKMKLYINKGVYVEKRVHQIVAECFPEICGYSFEGSEVDHLDGNKLNNDVSNLRVCTHRENLNNPNYKTKMSESQRNRYNK